MIEELELLRIGEIPNPGRVLCVPRGFQGDLAVRIRLATNLGSITRRARLIEGRKLRLLRLELRDDKIVLVLQVRNGLLLLSRERFMEKGSRRLGLLLLVREVIDTGSQSRCELRRRGGVWKPLVII